MRKFLITMMCIIMVVCFMPTVAMAEPTDVCPGGERCPHEAAIGNTHYEMLTDAISAVNDERASGKLVTLLKSVTVSDAVTISQNMVLDLCDNTLTCTSNGSTVFDDGRDVSFEIKNGSIRCTGDRAAFLWGDGGELSLTSVNVTADNARAIKMNGSATVTIGTGSIVTGHDHAIGMTGNGEKTLNIYGTVKGIGREAVYSSASDEPTIAIFDGAKVMSDELAAIWFTKPIVLKVSGGTLEGGNGNALLGEYENDEEIVEKIALNSNSSIASGYFDGSIDISSNTVPFITGGIFSNDPSQYVDTSKYKVKDNGNNTWTISALAKGELISEEGAKAQLESNGSIRYFSTLQDAINAVATNGIASTITILANVTTDTGFTIAEGQNITLDLNNNKIDSSKKSVINNYGTLNVTGTGTIECTKQNSYSLGIKNQGTLTVDQGVIVKGYFVAIENTGDTVFNGAAMNTAAADAVKWNSEAPIKQKGSSLTIGASATITGVNVALFLNKGQTTVNSTNVSGTIYFDGPANSNLKLAKTDALSEITLVGAMTLEGDADNYYAIRNLQYYPDRKVTLVTDSINSAITFSKDKKYELDLNGHTVQVATTAFTVNGNVVLDLNGGQVISTSAEKNTILVNSSGSLLIKDSKNIGKISGSMTKGGVIQNAGKLTLNGGTVEGPMAITIFGNGTKESATLTVDGATINGSDYAISGNGTVDAKNNYSGTKIDIIRGIITQHNDSNNGCAIYHPQDGVINISGGSITGDTGVQLCSGEGVIANISGNAVINGTAVDLRSGKTGDGLIPDGAAVSVVNRSYPGGTPKMTISGGTFKSEKSEALMAYTWSNNQASNWEKANEYLSVTGGTFTSNPIAYVPEVKCYTVSTDDEENPTLWTVTAGHTWDSGVVTIEPTYDTTGEKTYTCTVEGCGATKTEVIPKKDRPYIPSTPTTPTDNVTNSGTSGTDNATTSADLSGSTSTSNGTTSSTVDKTTADKIVDKAVENKSEEIVIDATANSTTAANSTTTAQVTIPTETLGAIAEKTEADVTIKTDVAEVKLDNASAAAVAEQAEGDTVQIIAEKVKEDATEVHFELKVVCSDGKVISDFKGGNVAVTVALPKAMADKKVVCVYIDDNGHMSKVEGQKNADGTYTFNTGHFSSYAIMAEEEADAAIAAQKEAIKNIKIKLTSKQVKTKAGKKAVKITWTADAGDKVLDGVEVFRSTERYKGYGTEPFYTSTKGGNTGSYTNTKSLKKGTKYYYRVRGYVLVDGQKVYTDYSTKAWRTVK